MRNSEIVGCEAQPPVAVHPFKAKVNVERFRNLAFDLSAKVCRLESYDEARFIFAAIAISIKSAPHILSADDIVESPASVGGRMAAAAVVSSLLKFYSESGFEHEFTAVLLKEALTPKELKLYSSELASSIMSCEATVAFKGGLFSLATTNVFSECRRCIIECIELGVINNSTASGCISTSFFLAFHAFYELDSLVRSTGLHHSSAALALASLSCALEAGYMQKISFSRPEERVVRAAREILSTVAEIGPRAQTMLGGVFVDTQKAPFFMTLQERLAAAELRLATLSAH